jgi:hypothetical protein
MPIMDFAIARPQARPGITLVELADHRWRVTRTNGEVLGYLDLIADGENTRFAAQRQITNHRGVLPLGEFWNSDDALDCFRP